MVVVLLFLLLCFLTFYLLLPNAYRENHFVVIPGAWLLASLQATSKLRASAGASEEFWQVLWLNHFKKLLLIL